CGISKRTGNEVSFFSLRAYDRCLSHERSRPMAISEHTPRVLAIDAGGTMTDTFIVDASGSFVVGKAQTTPEDESIGFMRSSGDALNYWSMEPRTARSEERRVGEECRS